MNNKFWTISKSSIQFGGLIKDFTQKHYQLKEGALTAFNRLKSELKEQGYTITAETETTFIDAFSAEQNDMSEWCYFVSVKEQIFE